MKVKHLVILIVFLLVVLEILRKNKNKKKSIQLIKNNLYSELKTRNDKNQKKINELEELLRKEQRWSFYLSVFTVLSICGLSIYIYMLIIKKKQIIDYLRLLSEMSTGTYIFNSKFQGQVQSHEINILDDEIKFSQQISEKLGLENATQKLILTNDIRNRQLELAKEILRFFS